MKTKFLGLMAIALLAGPVAANAVPMTYNWTITASNFTLFAGGGSPAPQDSFTALVSFVADPTSLTNSGTVSSFNLVIGSTTYTTASFTTISSAVFGNDCSVSCSVNNESPGFAISISNWATAPAFSSFLYSVGNGAIYRSSTGSLTASAVPEPGTLALLGLGLAGLGVSRRRKAN